jgi:uncharacterized RDD family membrane protein YckC
MNWDMFWANLLAGIINTILFWAVPIILAFIFRKKFMKFWKKINKLING